MMKKNTKLKKKESVKLKVVKTMNIFNIPVKDIYIFPNKNFLINADGIYKIYNDKNMCTRTKKDNHYKNINIIDNDSFLCLKDDNKLMNINLKTGKVTKIYEFPQRILNILYYKNKYISLGEDMKIDIWEKNFSNNQIQLLTTIALTKSKTIINIIPEKNILIVSIDEPIADHMNNGQYTYFYDLSSFKMINKLTGFIIEKIYKLNDDLYLIPEYSYCEGFSYVRIYDFTKNEIIKAIKNDDYKFSWNLEILTIPEKKIILLAGTNYTENGNTLYKDIIVMNYDFEKIFVMNNVHYRDIQGIKMYQKKENEYLILTYSEDGAVNVLSLI